MNFKAAIPGAVAVTASDYGSGMLPVAIDVSSLPIRAGVVAIAGAYLGLRLSGQSHSLKHAAIVGLVSLAGAEIADCALTSRIGGGSYKTFIRIGAGAATSMLVPLGS